MFICGPCRSGVRWESTTGPRIHLTPHHPTSWKSGDRATGSRGPSPEKLRQLAEGAGLPVATVFEAAGRHIPAPMDDEDERSFLHLLRSLDNADRTVIRATMEAMAERRTTQ